MKEVRRTQNSVGGELYRFVLLLNLPSQQKLILQMVQEVGNISISEVTDRMFSISAHKFSERGTHIRGTEK